jgi:hypothetical protein
MFAERYVPNWKATKLRQILSALALVVVIPALSYCWFLRPGSRHFSFDHTSFSASHSATSDNSLDEASSELLREFPSAPAPRSPVFPYSVIPGGVHSSRELREAVHRDALVAEHYSDFRFDSARVIRLIRDKKAYVSYRIGNQIYWTRRKVTLYAGEAFLSDGHSLARGRCGNRVSDVPKFPVAADEPSDLTMSSPLVFADPAALDGPVWDPPPAPATLMTFSPGIPVAPGVPLPPGGFYAPFPPPLILVPGSGGPSGSPSEPPPVVVPPTTTPVPTTEPSSLVLVFVGLAGLVILCMRRGR